MTQFALVKASNNSPHLKAIHELRNNFLSQVVGELFPASSGDGIFVICVEEMDIDALVLEAQKQIINSAKFEETLLFRVVYEIAQTSDEIIFWYGSDYNGLDYIGDVPALLGELESAVSDSACEVYIHYKKTKLDR